MRLSVDHLTVELDGTTILDEIELEVAEGERLVLLGPSGSGKSTLLRAVAGLQAPAAGRIRIDGRDVTDMPAYRRGIGLVFQDASLFPHRDVAGNVGFGLEVAGRRQAERADRVEATLELVGLAGFQRRPVASLSGGEAQRVALARALAPDPTILLLDEPLSALDGLLRDRLRDDLLVLWEQLRLTVVHVTHDIEEAFALADRVGVMREGRVVQVATPDELWERPIDAWVARFLGMENIELGVDRATITRPEAITLGPGDDAVVLTVERRRGVVVARVRYDDGRVLESLRVGVPPAPGERVGVVVDPRGVIEVASGAPDRVPSSPRGPSPR